jgi:hypothetical protein
MVVEFVVAMHVILASLLRVLHILDVKRAKLAFGVVFNGSRLSFSDMVCATHPSAVEVNEQVVSGRIHEDPDRVVLLNVYPFD